MTYNIDVNNIDYNRLREDLKTHFGTGMMIVSPAMMLDLSKVETCSDEELIIIAINNGFDINDYYINKHYR